jgi:hypothetical protein
LQHPPQHVPGTHEFWRDDTRPTYDRSGKLLQTNAI